MNKPAAFFLIFFTVCVVGFGTWMLYEGKLEAAFSTIPFLLIIYIFIRPFRKH